MQKITNAMSNLSCSKSYSTSSRTSGVPRSQSWVQMRACASLEVNEILYASSTRPPVLKVDSDATVDMGIAKYHEP